MKLVISHIKMVISRKVILCIFFAAVVSFVDLDEHTLKTLPKGITI